jgi:hypothetical protein
MATTVTTTFSGSPKAAVDAMHISANDVDGVDETDNSEIRYYLSAESGSHDAARSPVFSGDYDWNGWIPPVAGVWTIHLRKVEDDSAVAQLQVTATA